MIDIRQQEALFIALGNLIEKKISLYAIGGTAMMLRSIKDSTLDIDFVFDKKSDREKFIQALKRLGAKKSDATLVYGLKSSSPLMFTVENARFDLFLNKIITSTLSQTMKERAKQVHEFGKNLIVKVVDPHDIIIMKSVTSRTKDLDDISSIVEKIPIVWEVIVNEAKEQVKLGNERAVLALGEKLETLHNQKVIVVPKPILDELWKLLKKQISKKSKN